MDARAPLTAEPLAGGWPADAALPGTLVAPALTEGFMPAAVRLSKLAEAPDATSEETNAGSWSVAVGIGLPCPEAGGVTGVSCVAVAAVLPAGSAVPVGLHLVSAGLVVKGLASCACSLSMAVSRQVKDSAGKSQYERV